jgi:hypothetical protein
VCSVRHDVWRVQVLGKANDKLAERIWRKRVLWLLRASTTEIASMHAADLCGPYSPHGLDLTELRAVGNGCTLCPHSLTHSLTHARTHARTHRLPSK